MLHDKKILKALSMSEQIKKYMTEEEAEVYAKAPDYSSFCEKLEINACDRYYEDAPFAMKGVVHIF